MKNIPPLKTPNINKRTREYLTVEEISKIRKAIRKNTRYPDRNEVIILLMYRHALRVSELIDLKWEQVDFIRGVIHIVRKKNGISSIHPLGTEEIRLLRKIQKKSSSPFILCTERNSPFSARTIHHLIMQSGITANIGISIHPHMLRHATGFYLANSGQDTRAIQVYMGHANIKNTVLYTELTASRFKNFWK